MEALFVGKLVVRDGCLRASVDGIEEGYLVIWQPGYFLNDSGGVIEILDGDGQVAARVGEAMGLSGGELPLTADLKRQLREPFPEECEGPYWLMGETLFAFRTVPFAELVADPSRYDGLNVCTEGIYAQGFEVSALAASMYERDVLMYLTEPTIWIESTNLVSRSDCLTPSDALGAQTTEFCRVTVCGRFEHCRGCGHLGGYEFQLTSGLGVSEPASGDNTVSTEGIASADTSDTAPAATTPPLLLSTPTPTLAPTEVVEGTGGGDEAGRGERELVGQIMAQTGPNEATVFRYSLIIPEDWEGKYEIQEGEIAVCPGWWICTSVSFLYSVDPELRIPLFTITTYPKTQWEQLQTETGYHGAEITRIGEVVFAYTVSLDNPYTGSEAEEFQRLSGQVEEIVGTLRIE